MKYFVTGITGFACPHLARLLLQEGHEVHALIRGSNGRHYDLLDFLSLEEIEKVIWHYGDLTDYDSLLNIFENNQYDGVFHLGAQSHPPTSFLYPRLTMKNNVMGTINLMMAIEKTQPECVFQFTSTSEVYGDECKDVGVLVEDMPLRPSNPYGTSKAMVDLYVQERCKNGYMKGFITRAFSHTGARRGKNFSISWDAFHLAEMFHTPHIGNRNLPVGNLKTQRIVIDVMDCMRAYYLLMQKFHFYENNLVKDVEGNKNPINGQAYNVCGAMEDVKEMGYFTDMLIDISGIKDVKKVIDKRVYRPIDIQVQVGDTTKIKRAIGWKPEVPLRETLTNLYNYWVRKLSL